MTMAELLLSQSSKDEGNLAIDHIRSMQDIYYVTPVDLLQAEPAIKLENKDDIITISNDESVLKLKTIKEDEITMEKKYGLQESC